MTSRGLSFSRSLAVLQGKILGCSAFKCLPLFVSLSFSAALPLESGCKGTHFFLSCNFYAILFCRIFEYFFVNHWKQGGCRWKFFDAFKNGRKRHYIIYFARACVRAHACMCKTRTAGTFLSKVPDIFYVFLSENVGFRPRKRTFHGRETYVSPDGNIEILNTTKDYLTGISSIRNA